MDLRDSIEKCRRELLELSARNRLIHTPLESTRSSAIRIVGEQSDSLFERLVRQGKSMAFLPKDADATQSSNTANVAEPRVPFVGSSDANHDSKESDLSGPDADESIGPFSNPESVRSSSSQSISGHGDDRFLQTLIPADKLDDRLLRCFYEARTSEEEQGVSILYLACGFLKWREKGSSTVHRYAPLILIPVELSRNHARSQFRLKFRDEDFVTNLSIQARLLHDFGIRILSLPENIDDETEAWAPSKYFTHISKLIDGREGWELLTNEVVLWFFSFTKFLMFRDLSSEAWPKTAGLENHPLLRSLLVDGFPPSAPDSDLDDDLPIDKLLNPADVIHVTDADSSQAIVIHEVAQGRNLVVQGPPGTGKSQTITNAIAAAVHAGKRVLFVSEKMAALEVVKRRLDLLGLGPMALELHSHKARKQGFLAELKATLDLGTPASLPAVPLDELRQTSLKLREHDAALHQSFENTGVTPFQAIGQIMRLKAMGLSPINSIAPQAAEWTEAEFRLRRTTAVELDQLLTHSGIPSKNVWHGASCQPMTPMEVERFTAGLQKLITPLQEMSEWAAKLSNSLGLPKACNLATIADQAQLAQHLRRRPEHLDRKGMDSEKWDSGLAEIEKGIELLAKVQELREQVQSKVTDAGIAMDLNGTRHAIASHGSSWFRFFYSSYRSAMQTFRGIVKQEIPKSASERVEWLDSVIRYQSSLSQFEKRSPCLHEALGNRFQGLETSLEHARAALQWFKEGCQFTLFKQYGRKLAAGLTDFGPVSDPLARIAKSMKELDLRLNEVAGQLKLNARKAFHVDLIRSIELDDWLCRIREWMSHPEQLGHYLAVRTRLDRLEPGGLEPLVQAIEDGSIKAGAIANQLDFLRAESILSAAWRSRPGLGEFQGHTYEALRLRFAALDRERIGWSRWEVAQKHFTNLPSSAGESGQVGLVRREINKKRCHKPIRSLLREAGQAIQKIKPVFMMSPLSVAQFLEPGAVEFDLLVIDEASQVQPVDALGAIARCRQIVVVGDQQQLPPSHFFDRISGDSDTLLEDDSGNDAGDLESILGLCESQGLPNRLLRWHYRSKHESLIAVSNRFFYDERLFIVPSPVSSGGPLGLKFHMVVDGIYDRGGTRTNQKEAEAIADAVMNHARHRPNWSLGVATFSSAQRDAILDELEIRRRASPALEDFFATGGPAPFFVKSLENVQGDERDFIFISVGYGKDKDGYFAHQFGPLNRQGGHRRLNVLISRASSSCEVFSSIRANDIELSRSSGEGVSALKSFLHYAETRQLDHRLPTTAAQSDFEKQVAESLQAHGLEIEHRVGIGGFYIDLAVRDPENRGRYWLGIECDGESFHRARWVRDRDRLRQQILESRGWIIHRIWSADWFQHPEQQRQLALKAIEEARQRSNDDEHLLARSSTSLSDNPSREAAIDPPPWKRLSAEESSDMPPPDQPTLYVEANISIPAQSGSLANLKLPQFNRFILQILETEAPIHMDEIGRRLIKMFGEGRLVASFRQKIESALTLLEQKHQATRRGDFAYRAEQTVFPVRSRRKLENANLRKPELIAPEELQAAIVKSVAENIGTSTSETCSLAAKLLGISNSPSAQRFLMEAMTRLHSNSILVDRDGKLFVTERPF